MMNYEEFKAKTKESFMHYMPTSYQHLKVQIIPCTKINCILDGLTLQCPKAKQSISPTLYVNHMYEFYQRSGNFDATMEKFAFTMETAFETLPPIPRADPNTSKEHIVFQLINAEQNTALLEKVPHRNFHDLAIIYRWIMEIPDDGITSAIVTDRIAKNLGFDEVQLYKLAVSNTKRLFPPTIKPIGTVLSELFLKDGTLSDMADNLFGTFSENPMYVISNDRGINGAITMLYEEQLHYLAKQLDDSLYILPSSVHEVIAIPKASNDPEVLAEMVTEINTTQLHFSERLSNQIYYYDKVLRTLTLATNNKLLSATPA